MKPITADDDTTTVRVLTHHHPGTVTVSIQRRDPPALHDPRPYFFRLPQEKMVEASSTHEHGNSIWLLDLDAGPVKMQTSAIDVLFD